MELKDISEILDFDEAQLEQVMKVHAQKLGMVEFIAEKKQAMEASKWEETKHQLASKKSELDKQIRHEEKANNEKLVVEIKELTQAYEARKQEWLEELFDNCLK